MLDERDLPWLAEPLAQLRDHPRSHALILHGGAGSGQWELAWRVAQAWLCENGPGPCGECPSCHLTVAHSHPDLKVLMPEATQLALGWSDAGDDGDSEGGEGGKSKRKPSREIKIDAVRAAIDWAHTSSGRGRGKVLLFYPADAMNVTSANALLKTLEEPAAGTRLLLCVDDPERLLPTVRSRCQRVRLEPPDLAAAEAWLTRQGVAGAAALLRASGGEPLAAKALLDEGLDATVWGQLPAQVAQGDSRALAAMPLPRAVRVLQQVCHDAMAQAAGGAPRFFMPGQVPLGAEIAGLADWSRELARVARHDEHPWNAPLRVEALVAQAQRVWSAG
ncbi:DNA polymerase III subunit delta' [Ideonella sp. DXS29W]|uniref:DNA polymerase III subunit delta n=1 Tax=Ideonella lacteola TaxID=2984193 RepID=A0ABU9BVJ1_9BURK